MKKLLLIVALLTISLTLTFAQDVTAKIVGEAGTKWELDLGPEIPIGGFSTWAQATIEIDANTGGKELKSDQQVYGYVKVSNLDLGQYRMGWYTSADGWANAWDDGFKELWTWDWDDNPAPGEDNWGPEWGGAWARLVGIDMAQTLGTNAPGSEPKNPSIEAKIVAGPIYIKFDGNTYCRAERFMDSSALQFKDTVLGLGINKLWVDLGNGTGIVEIGYSGDAVAVAAKISSAGDKASNTYNEYRMGVDASIKAVPNLEATAGAYTAMSGQTDFVAPIHMGVKVGYTVKLSEDMSVKPFAGAEIIMHGEDAMKMEIGGGINLKWPGISWDYDWALGDAMIDYWVGWPKHFVNFSGANLYVNYVSLDADTNMVGARVTMFDDTGDSGILPMVGVGLLGIMNMYLASDTLAESYNEIGVGLWIEAQPAPGIKPFVAMEMLMANDVSILEQNTTISLGAEITSIPNAIITIAYDGQGRNITSDAETGTLGIIRAQFRFKYY
jgi:hypothetical protein